MGGADVQATEPERVLSWRADGASGTAVLEPAGWGTKVTLTAETEGAVARQGIWTRLAAPPAGSPHDGLEQRLEEVLDDLGSAHRRPFSRAD